MKELAGKPIYKGIAIGEIYFFSKDQGQVKRYKIEDADAEIARCEQARAKSIEQLNKIHDDAVAKVGEENAAVFEVHAMMLEDDDYIDSINNIISTQMVNAEYAVATTADNFAEMFASMDDEYMSARAADVKDISERVINNLLGKEEQGGFTKPVIVVADDLAPSETVQMDKELVLAFVTEHGSSNSHTAILARTMNIPALIGVEIDAAWNGKLAIVDGHNGKFIIEPDLETIEKYQALKKKDDDAEKLLAELKGKETVTLDGKKIMLYANIGSISDLVSVLKNDAGGIGLFRSEFIYLGRDSAPTEEEQFNIYKSVAETMAGKKVVIRTLDIGADKTVDYLGLDKEENPALGYRAIRICLTRPELFKTQLRAIFRASAYGKIAIMYPMIISVNEVRRIKEVVAEVKAELDAAGIPYGDVEQGVMIETPAAVIMTDELAKEVDFFSIGTNDLTQYTLAIDRQNPNLEEFYDAHHPAILRSIKTVVDNGHKENCWVGICGELGADTKLTETFVKMGVDELSVSPSAIFPIRKIIRETKVND